jgi:hypothetical protein
LAGSTQRMDDRSQIDGWQRIKSMKRERSPRQNVKNCRRLAAPEKRPRADATIKQGKTSIGSADGLQISGGTSCDGAC